MKKYMVSFTLILSFLVPSIAQSAPEEEQLGKCLTGSLNGNERKNLAIWVFFGMSSHSEIKPYANISQQNIDDIDKFVGELMTRLLTEDCANEVIAVFNQYGTAGLEQAFRLVGEVAMQELMLEPVVTQSLGAFEKHLDTEKLMNILQ